MMFEFLENITTADVAFRARGKTMEEMFLSAAQALVSIMIENPGSIASDEHREITLHSGGIDMLLYDFLQELLFFKDSEGILLLPRDLVISQGEKGYSLSCRASGESIKKKHTTIIDVKSITFHRFEVKQTDNEWQSTVVVDV